MSRVEITYDFDYKSLEYYKNGINNFPGGRFNSDEKFEIIEFLKEWPNLDSLNFLGTGLDKLVICYSESHSVFVIEPCSAMFFLCKMEESFSYIIRELGKNVNRVKGAGIETVESFFRTLSDRGEKEINVGIDLIKRETGDWDIVFYKSEQDFSFSCPLDKFLSAYFEFGERMIRFYDHVLPEYKEFKYYYPLFIKAVRESVITTKFEIKPQSSYDDKTYYDFQ